jgi:Holliday junction resolvase
MFKTKSKGYRTERKIRILFEKHGWRVIRAGASIGEADLICIKQGKCLFLQVKSTKKKTFYYYGFMKKRLEGIPYYLVVDFGYNRIRILPPKKIVQIDDGDDLKMFLQRFKI